MKSWYQKEQKTQIKNVREYMDTDSDILDFLAELEILYHVPYAYLLPKDDLLLEEQIGFFYLDSEWIRCMQQGALSIGCASEVEKRWSKEAGRFYRTAVKARSGHLREKMFGLPEKDEKTFVRSGFLLRSEAVRCWPGIEVKCWEDEKVRTEDTRLSILRLEKIAKDTLLCIVSGDIKAVELSQPPEGIYMEAKNKKETGMDIIFRKEAKGVLDIKAMTEALARTKNVTPEEFGAVFLHKQTKYIFTPKYKG